MTEQSGPKELVQTQFRQKSAGFDFEVCSDHFSPWLAAQGHAPNAWAVLGAVAHATEHVDLYSYVTCPTMRYHPAIVAQQAATVQILSDGRFTLGLGSGENLNEHVVGLGWPTIQRRLDMLQEAIQIIRALFDGDLVDWQGDYFQVDSARLWDVPDVPVAIGVSMTGQRSIEQFGVLSDHLIAVAPDADLVKSWHSSRQAKGSRVAGASSVRSRSAGTPTGMPPSRGRMTSSAGSAADGPSTPTYRPPWVSRGRPGSSDPMTSPRAFPCGPDLTPSSKPPAPTGRQDSPTSRSSR